MGGRRVRELLRALVLGPWSVCGLAALALLGVAEVSAGPLEVPPSARGESAVSDDVAHVEARLLVDRTGERTFRVGVHFRMDHGWHIYWRNSGQSGLPTELAWTFPGRVGPIAWPAPKVFSEADGFITTYGYADEVLLAQTAELRPDAAPLAEVAVVADFLACEVQCIPGRIELSRPLPSVASAQTPDGRALHALFESFAERVPVPPDEVGVRLEAFFSQTAIRPGDAFRAAVAVTPAGLAPGRVPAFVPDRMAGVELLVTGSRPHPFAAHGGFVTLAGRASPDPVPEAESRLRGVLGVRTRDGVRYVEVDLALPRAAAGADVATVPSPWLEPEEVAGGVSIAGALLLALLGGLILNLMPCVLPVLAIKVVSVTELAQRNAPPAERLGQGLAYTLGVGVTMTALAIVVLSLRAAGTAVGWGFQFQEPLFVAGVSAVLLVFALNLLGTFEFTWSGTGLADLGQAGGSLSRSFFEGLLAVVLATPCTAPFLGTAVGLAFASSAPVVIGVFLAIGLGLAAPFLLVCLLPGLARWIPRSGGWMIQLRRSLGFAVLATMVWLLWIAGRSAGVDGMAALLAWLVALAFATYVYGAAQAALRRGWMAGALVAGVGVLALAAGLPLEAGLSEAADAGDPSAAAEYDPGEIDAALAAGRPVFVYFTADWCLTCKVNERVVLASGVVQRRLEGLGFATFRGDWTRRDEQIRAELARFGRAGVPMYLVYSPSAPAAPELLPELLTVDLLVDALERAAPSTVGAKTPRSNS